MQDRETSPSHCCQGATLEHPRPRPRLAYFCPMCPGVESERPGVCPVCGMALESAGGDDQNDPELADMTRRLWVAGALTLPVFALAMAHMLPWLARQGWVDGPASRWIQFGLSTPVVAWAGLPFFRRGWSSIRTGRLNMFTLISLGVGAAFLFSAAALLAPGLFPEAARHHGPVPVYFEAAAVIIVLVLLGQVLEMRARRRTGNALRELIALAPATARRVEPGGDREVALDRIKPGDLLRVVPGDRIPVDGTLLQGRGAVDEALLTGEALPVEKEPGDPVRAGTLNGSGSFVIRADSIGAETLLGRIVAQVAEAQRSRAPIQALADRVARIFVPAVLGAALLAFLAWILLGPEPRLAHALTAAVAVLIIACPCALGLATPMSIMVAVGRGARAGVLVKNAEALQGLERVDTLVVDKTGTLTEGRPELAQVFASDGFEADHLLRLAASLEQASEHPLAGALVRAAAERGLSLEQPTEVRVEPGGGIEGRILGLAVRIGTPAFLRRSGLEGLEPLEEQVSAARTEGQSAVLIAVEGRPAGAIVLADRLKPRAREALDALRVLGLGIVMLTGDHRRAAAAVAARLGIDSFEAEIDPLEKAERIRALRSAGRRVAMAGDGINDAPALAAADAGIAMGTGAGSAIQSAGITLLRGDLERVASALRLARATMMNIRQNLLFAFLYNGLGIPVAAGLLYPWFGVLLSPMLAGAAMSLSSVSVVANALRLGRARL